MLLAARLAIFLCLPIFLGAVLSAQNITISQPTIWVDKPDVAAFEKIENDRLAAGQRAIDTLLAAKGPRTIENTLVPFDEAVRQNNSAGYFAGLMEQVHPDSTFRDHATAMLTKASAAQTAIALNHEVYNALAALDLSKSDDATRYYVQRQLLEFRLAGVDKDDATRARLKKLNDQATEEQSMFDRNISDDQKIVAGQPIRAQNGQDSLATLPLRTFLIERIPVLAEWLPTLPALDRHSLVRLWPPVQQRAGLRFAVHRLEVSCR